MLCCVLNMESCLFGTPGPGIHETAIFSMAKPANADQHDSLSWELHLLNQRTGFVRGPGYPLADSRPFVEPFLQPGGTERLAGIDAVRCLGCSGNSFVFSVMR